MWIDKDIIPALIHAVEITIKEEIDAFDLDDFNPDEHYNPSDIIIFENFVLPVLKENLKYGFYATEMLSKGFELMMGMVQSYINEQKQNLSNECLASLFYLHYSYYIKESLHHLNQLGSDGIVNNTEIINRCIDRAKLHFTPRKTSKAVVIPLKPNTPFNP